MPAAEIAAAVTSVNALLNVAKAMVGLRDAETFRARAIEFEGLILDSLTKAVQATEVQATQLDEIRALKAEVADLKAWGSEKEQYELKPVGYGAVAYMLKPEARGPKPPHWLCPNCYTQGKKGFIQPSGGTSGRATLYACTGCGGKIASEHLPAWRD
jgi:hypothetical protein